VYLHGHKRTQKAYFFNLFEIGKKSAFASLIELYLNSLDTYNYKKIKKVSKKGHLFVFILLLFTVKENYLKFLSKRRRQK